MSKIYRYDGVDEDGQHWLEEVEIIPGGEERYTEHYVPMSWLEISKEQARNLTKGTFKQLEPAGVRREIPR